MANNQIVTVKVKDPRSLGQKETRENLDHWFDQVKSYLKRDDNLRIFLLEETQYMVSGGGILLAIILVTAIHYFG